ncbi:hypothetical protein [Amycolatopsis samaneae]|uniref:Uncharacterized protein n=1 Tax=Amycolatopsis samaneae TaxID=664691 RepID=A0ABW5GTG0_9PSEU
MFETSEGELAGRRVAIARNGHTENGTVQKYQHAEGMRWYTVPVRLDSGVWVHALIREIEEQATASTEVA